MKPPALPSEPEVLELEWLTQLRREHAEISASMARISGMPDTVVVRNTLGKTRKIVGEYDQLLAHIDALRARCAQLEADAALIDFVQANHYSVMCWDVNGTINNGFTIGSDDGEMDDIAAGRTWRECIQWAMKRAARSTPTSGLSKEVKR